MKALELLKADRDHCQLIHNDNSIIEQYNEAIKLKEQLEKDSKGVVEVKRENNTVYIATISGGKDKIKYV